MVQPLDSSVFFNKPLSNITPFTYRDGETYLEKLNRLCRYINEVAAELQANIDSVEQQDKDAITVLTKQLNDALLEFINFWTQQLQDMQDQFPTLAFDPTNGTTTETISRVIGNVYDNLRYYAYFASQLDYFEYTAKQWDDMQYSARHFDLILGYSPTTTQATISIPPTVTPN